MKHLLATLLAITTCMIASALPTAVKNRTFFEGITYSWPYNADPSAQQQSNLGEIATDPDQIIAMLREVYMNKSIPGNYARGYSAEGVNEGTWANGTATGNYPVAYPAIGTIAETNGSIGFSDTFGWDLPGDFFCASKTPHTVTFDASIDRSSTGSLTKDGITISMSKLNSSNSAQTLFYYDSVTGNKIGITADSGIEITKVYMIFIDTTYPSNFTNDNYKPAVGFYTTKTLYYNGSNRGTVTWQGSASSLSLSHYSGARIMSIAVTYETSSRTRFSHNEVMSVNNWQDGSTSFICGTDKPANSNTKTYTKDHVTISMYNLVATPYRTSSGDFYIEADPGYVLTSIKFTCNDGCKMTSADCCINSGFVTIKNLSVFINNKEFLFDSPTTKLILHSKSENNIPRIDVTYKYIGEDKIDAYYIEKGSYTPTEEGNTVLLLEVKDGMTIDGLFTAGLATKNSNNKFDNYNISDYATLRAVVAATIKSARVLTDAKRVGSGVNAGTLFKIDADKLNRFYLLGKGQLRWFNNDSYGNAVNAFYRNWDQFDFVEKQPYFMVNSYSDYSTEALFSHMFEQFSPSMATGGTALNDVYRLLVNGDHFNVVHDCLDVISAESTGHEFNMYGKESLSEDCQDVRDMMFFVPDYRMLTHEGNSTVSKRDPNNAQRFLYYNPDHAPTLGLYVIKQNAITGSKQADADVYDLNLSWASNLLTFLPGEDAVYELLRVTTNADGTKSYTPVGTLDANTTTYIDHVPMQTSSQVVTYAVRGQDSSHFLSLQLSNEESFVVPGTDVSETMNLVLNADHWSRFDPQEEKNNYSNTISMGNNQVTNITSANLQSEHLFTFTRSYTDATGDHTDVIATATADVANNNMTVTMQNQDFFTYGYQTNNNNASAENADGQSFTLPITITTTGVNFGSFKLYDNFSVSVADNQHPNQYTYQVLFQFDGNDKFAKSNTMSVYVHKTAMEMEPEGGRAVSRDDIDGDVTRSLPANGTVDFDIDVKYSSKKEILRYDAYRWPEGANRYIIEPNSPVNNEQDVPPTGIAGNQGDRYTVAMNADNFLYTGETTTLGDEQTATQAHFVDNYVRDAAGIYTYVPVVEVFPPNESRSDYNTYGAPLQQAATGTVAVSERTSYTQTDNGQDTYPQKSSYTWQDADGTLCAYYTFLLNLDADIPNGYELYKVRAWRQMDTEYQYEELADRNFRKGSDVLFAEYTFPDYTKDSNTYWPIGAGDPMQSVSNQGGKVVGEMAGTFGAIDVTKANGGQGIDIPITFVVRAYYTREANMADLNTISGNAPRRLDAVSEADGKYYVLEKTIVTTLKGTEGDNQIVTALTDAVADVREVADVTYYNMTGAASKRPFDGVNIKVTRYTDGSTMTKKVLIK